MAESTFSCPITRGERILVALDGSHFSEKALEQALSMAKICNSSLFAISVVDLYPEVMAHAPELEEKLSREVGETLERAKQTADKENISCETIVRMGGPAHEFIVQEAKDRDIDLIVMGTRGKSALERVVMGSVAERVIGHAPCPVMVIPS
jgi:nucleotide-binding universal stress UspA family protein